MGLRTKSFGKVIPKHCAAIGSGSVETFVKLWAKSSRDWIVKGGSKGN